MKGKGDFITSTELTTITTITPEEPVNNQVISYVLLSKTKFSFKYFYVWFEKLINKDFVLPFETLLFDYLVKKLMFEYLMKHPVLIAYPSNEGKHLSIVEDVFFKHNSQELVFKLSQQLART